MIQLRDYQQAAVSALVGGWSQGVRSGLVVLPTGTGKSMVQAETIRQLASGSEAVRLLAVTHVRELIAQKDATNSKKPPAPPPAVVATAPSLPLPDSFSHLLS